MTAEDKRLDRQQAYQHFHIGLYVSLALALIGAVVFDKTPEAGWVRWLPPLSLALLALAGACGGVVAARIPECSSYEQFLDDPLRIHLLIWSVTPAWGPKRFEVLEHQLFWMAVLVLAAYSIAAVWPI